MKRRNAECGKIRRPVKRSKIAEGIYGSTFLYLKFLLVWALVLLADFILEFRFEYLWPFWLLLRSVYDSFKYQGLAFSVFFIFIAFTSDMICFLFIPVHWLFFAASTYVWVQYVWHTERGICLPTISLWLLFVYIEASVRLKELKNLPFNLDLCRPFAAHCIGYPVVTLGFGFKSYVGYRMKLRKQKDVARENDFYIQLLQQALPSETPSIAAGVTPEKSTLKYGDEVISNGVGHCSPNHVQQQKKTSFSVNSSVTNNSSNATTTTTTPVTGGGGGGSNAVLSNHQVSKYSELDSRAEKGKPNNASSPQANSANLLDKQDYQYMENHIAKRTVSVNDYDETDENCEKDKTAFKSNGISAINTNTGSLPSATRGNNASSGSRWNHNHNSAKDNSSTQTQSSGGGGGKKNKNNMAKEITNNHINSQKDDYLSRLESDIKRLKADLQSSRQCEQDLRLQIHNLTSGEKSVKNELTQFQLDNENLQTKLHNLVTARQQDKQTISQLEKKLAEERRTRSSIESQLSSERKAKKAEEAAAARAVAMATSRTECTEICKQRRREFENEVKQLRRELKMREDQFRQIERETQTLRQYKDSHGETDVLMSALSAMQDKNSHLENSLSAETRVKLDLFSALGEAKRQLEIRQSLLVQKDKEIGELKSRIAEVMAVMPVANNSVYPSSVAVSLDSGMVAPMIYSPKFLPDESCLGVSAKSQLDPNASVYTPKVVPSDI